MVSPLYVSRNGALIPPGEAAISVFNPAIYGAYGVYESMQVRNGIVFEQDAHLARLAHSSQIIGLPLPADLPTIGRWIAGVLAANRMDDCDDCIVRLFMIGPENGECVTAYIWPQGSPVYPSACYTEGVSAITFEAQRYLPEAKSLNTLVSFMAQRAARAAGAHEALLYDNDQLTEGSNSNLYAVIRGEMVTPPARQVLSGVTRDVVLHLASAHRLPSREAPLALAGLAGWSECFITSTSRHIMPVTRIDGQPVGDGTIGPVTQQLSDLFEVYFEAKTRRA
jgi:branched-subunit amino acid aminotransferase/4-amino-4-deoxychorismate lyase